MSTSSLHKALFKLSTALEWGVSPVCIELDTSGSPAACIRSSNGSQQLLLSSEEAISLIDWLRKAVGQLAHLNPNLTDVINLSGQRYRANFCPQLHGEIVTLHCQDEVQSLL